MQNMAPVFGGYQFNPVSRYICKIFLRKKPARILNCFDDVVGYLSLIDGLTALNGNFSERFGQFRKTPPVSGLRSSAILEKHTAG